MILNLCAQSAIAAHALRDFPREACGLVMPDGRYLPVPNVAENPARDFAMPDEAMLLKPVAVVHSHCAPNRPEPSGCDHQHQKACAVPFGIVWTDGKTVMAPIWIGA